MRADLVEQRDGERAPFDDRLVTGLEACRSAAATAWAAARRHRPAGRRCDTRAGPVSASSSTTFRPALFDRLDQRVGQPLRELVERHEADRPDAARHRPSATARSARACRAPRRGSRRPSPRLHPSRSTSNSAPGRSRPTLPSLRSRSARPSSPTSGLCAFTWKPMAMSIGVSAASRSASTRSGSPLASRLKAPLANIWKLATPRPSERA